MLRHLHFVQSVETLEGGGLGRAASDLNDALSCNLANSTLITTGSVKQRVSESGDFVYKRLGPAKFFFSWEMTMDISSIVNNVNVIHGHGFYVFTNWLIGREAKRHSKPLVYHPHGMFEPWILARSRWKKRLAHLLFENANFRYASLWRALTLKEADQIRAQGIIAPIVEAPNGIDLDAFKGIPALHAQFAADKKRNVLLFLARIHPKKGLPLLVEAWSRLDPALRRDWMVCIAGPDELGHRAEVEALIAQHGLQADFEFTGSVSGDDKLAVLAKADAFILPSYSEGFSVAILEALACRLPVIATHACNFPALATDGGGWCVDTSVDALLAALSELMSESSAGLHQRGENARRLVEQKYTWPHIAAMIDSACRDLVLK